MRRVAIGLLAPVLIAARCSEREPAAPPVATPTASQPTTAPAVASPERPDTAAVDAPALELPTNGWLRVERLRENVEGGWVSGHSPTRNRIVIETQSVAEFSMDVSRLDLDWSRRVWVRIDHYSFELTHKRNPVVHLRVTPAGAWELVKPHNE